MAEHHSGMENLSVLVIDEDRTSLLLICEKFEKLSFKVFTVQTEQAALDFLRKGRAKEGELDLILAEVHLSTMAPRTLANSELLNHIKNEVHVPFVSMCDNDDEDAISECMAIGACFHLQKPLTTGRFNMLRHTARKHKSKRAAPEGLNTFHTVSSSTETPKEMLHQEPKVCEARGRSKKPDQLRLKAHHFAKKADRLSWTVDLHKQFLEALEVLGENDAVPRKILKHMNIKNLTLKQVSSHLQKHRLQQLKEQQEGQQNASNKPVSEQIRSSHTASTTESITPKVAADIREVYPPRLWTNMKKRSAEAMALKAHSYTSTSRIFRDDTRSVWDKYHKSLQNDPSSCTSGIFRDDTKSMWDKYHKSLHDGLLLSTRQCQYEQSASSKGVARDEGASSEGPKTAGEIGYGAPFESSGSNSLLTRSLGQTKKNNLTENALLDDTNKSYSAQMYLAGPANNREELGSFWMSQMGGPQEQLNIRQEDRLQVDEAPVLGTQQSLVTLIQPITQEATVGDIPVPDPMMQFALTQEAAVGDAAVPDPVMQFAQTQEAAIVDAPVLDDATQCAEEEDIYRSLSPLVGDYDMLVGSDSESA